MIEVGRDAAAHADCTNNRTVDDDGHSAFTNDELSGTEVIVPPAGVSDAVPYVALSLREFAGIC